MSLSFSSAKHSGENQKYDTVTTPFRTNVVVEMNVKFRLTDKEIVMNDGE